ncbi:MAG: hypothetical protein WDN72_00955 [Alphaproteobacteria bacterium]
MAQTETLPNALHGEFVSTTHRYGRIPVEAKLTPAKLDQTIFVTLVCSPHAPKCDSLTIDYWRTRQADGINPDNNLPSHNTIDRGKSIEINRDGSIITTTAAGGRYWVDGNESSGADGSLNGGLEGRGTHPVFAQHIIDAAARLVRHGIVVPKYSQLHDQSYTPVDPDVKGDRYAHSTEYTIRHSDAGQLKHLIDKTLRRVPAIDGVN